MYFDTSPYFKMASKTRTIQNGKEYISISHYDHKKIYYIYYIYSFELKEMRNFLELKKRRN